MYGLINSALQNMIRDKFGDEEWEKVLAASGVPEDSFLTMRSYDDALTYQLAGAASEVLGAPVRPAWRCSASTGCLRWRQNPTVC